MAEIEVTDKVILTLPTVVLKPLTGHQILALLEEYVRVIDWLTTTSRVKRVPPALRITVDAAPHRSGIYNGIGPTVILPFEYATTMVRQDFLRTKKGVDIVKAIALTFLPYYACEIGQECYYSNRLNCPLFSRALTGQEDFYGKKILDFEP